MAVVLCISRIWSQLKVFQFPIFPVGLIFHLNKTTHLRCTRLRWGWRCWQSGRRGGWWPQVGGLTFWGGRYWQGRVRCWLWCHTCRWRRFFYRRLKFSKKEINNPYIALKHYSLQQKLSWKILGSIQKLKFTNSFVAEAWNFTYKTQKLFFFLE